MGLREKKAARARAHMLEVAVATFLDQGYDETTMEQIAELAEVSTSTLYRYFPSKDLLVLDRLANQTNVAQFLADRPEDETPAAALGAAVVASAAYYDNPSLRIPQLRRVIDNAPVPRARLWDLVLQNRADLEVELARRMGKAADDIEVRVSAGIAVDILQTADDEWKRGHHRKYEELVRDLLSGLAAAQITVPAAPEEIAAAG